MWFNKKTSVIEKAASRSNSRVLFEILRARTNQRSIVNDKIKDANGNVILGKSEKLKRRPDYFGYLLNKDVPLQLDTELQITLTKYIYYLAAPSQYEVNTVIKALKKNMIPGADRISVDACKMARKTLAKCL